MRSQPHRMAHQAVLFDLDGTLLDTLEDLADTMNRVLRTNGLPMHPTASYRYFVGDGVQTLVLRAIPQEMRGDEETVRKLESEMREEYRLSWDRKTRPYEGAAGLLARLTEMGIKRAVLSNKPHGLVAEMLDRYFPGVFFEAAFGNRPGIPKKPDPAAALEISRICGVPPASFLYLGDTDTDMRTARAAGMSPVGALWGFREEDELRRAGAERLIAAPPELIALL
jgi:phosphoglycolate phosphatase